MLLKFGVIAVIGAYIFLFLADKKFTALMINVLMDFVQ